MRSARRALRWRSVAAAMTRRSRQAAARTPEQAEAVTLKVGVIPIADVAPLYLGHQEGLLRGGEADDRAAARRGRRGDHPVGDVRRLPDRVLEHDVAADRRVQEAAGPDHLPGRAGRHDPGRRVGRGRAPEGLATSRRPRTSRARRSRSTRSTTSARVTINNWLEKNGADYKKVKYVEVPFPEMGAALEAKRVDAAFTVEPAYSGAVAAGGSAAVQLLRRDGAEPHRRHVLRVQAVHRREQGDRRALQAGDGRSRSSTRRQNDAEVRGGGRRVHADPGRGDRQDPPADVAAPTSTSRRSRPCPTWRSSTVSSRRQPNAG